MQMNHFLKIVYLLIIGYSNLFSQIKLDVSTIPKRVDVYLDGVN